MSKIVALFLILIAGLLKAQAGIRPSFSLDYSSWNATDIVIATEGDIIDGNFTILETIKGGKLPHQQISIPELAEFKSQESRQVKEWYGEKTLAPAKFVTNQKMILFLKKSTTIEGKWETADLFKNFPTSVLWLEGNEIFAFIQTINPGPSLLVESGMKEAGIRQRIAEVQAINDSLNNRLKIKDKSKRAEALEEFAKSDFYLAQSQAFDELAKCGEAALPVLQKILAHQNNSDDTYLTFQAMETIGGNKVGEFLTEIIKEELAFWQNTVPKLNRYWWRDKKEAQFNSLVFHYHKATNVIYRLRMLQYKNSTRFVTQFCDYWRLQPKLSSKEDNQVQEVCLDYFKTINN